MTYSSCFTLDVETQLFALPDVGLGQPEMLRGGFGSTLALNSSPSANERGGAAVQPRTADAATERNPSLLTWEDSFATAFWL